MSRVTRDKLAHLEDVYHVFVRDRFYIPQTHRCEHTSPLLAICDWSHPSAPPREVAEDAVDVSVFPPDITEYLMEQGAAVVEQDGDVDNPVDTLVHIMEYLGAGRRFVSRELLIDTASIGGTLDIATTVTELLETLILLGVVLENEHGQVMLCTALQG